MLESFNGQTPEVHPGAFVHERAEVIGRVRLGPRVSIWPGAVLRGDVEEIVIGEGTNIQDNTVIHTDLGIPTVLGEGISVGHSAILHGCRVGSNSLIGMGAILLNDVIVEDECWIGAGALVAPGTRIPRGHMALGVPARVTRPLRFDELEHIRRNGQNYLDCTEKHRQTSRSL
jgi:carbonic anhydrase/acetyltransferase-like protein (isoleucine patch superfamily)